MKFQAEESGVFRLLMGYLRDKKLFETLNSLQLEIGQAEEDLGTDLLYLQRIILQGRWDDVILFVKPFEEALGEGYDMLEYVIHRQQFLEAVSWHGGGGHRHALLPWKPKKSDGEIDGELEIDVVVQLLKSLELLCPSQEFSSLCLCLTLEKLSDNPDFSHWTVSQGRLDSFQSIKTIVCPLLEKGQINLQRAGSHNGKGGCGSNAKGSPGGLLIMLAMALAYQVQSFETVSERTFEKRESDDSAQTVFDGSILVVEGLNSLRSLNSKLQPPSIALTGVVTNQLYSHGANTVRDRNPSFSPLDLVDDAENSRLVPSQVTTRGGRDYSSNSQALPSPSHAPSKRQVDDEHSAAAEPFSPLKAAARATPLAWTVEAQGAKEREPEKVRAPRVGNRRLTVSAVQAPELGTQKEKETAVASNDEERGEKEKVRDVTVSEAASSSPAKRSSSAVSRNRRDTIGNILNTSTIKADRGKQVATQGQDKNNSVQVDSSVLFQTDCPLRCVCVLGESTALRQGDRHSSSWMFAVGSNDKSVKVMRVMDSAPSKGASVDIVREFSEAHRGSIYAVDWRATPEGPGLLATASNDKAIRILNVGAGTMGTPLKGHTGTIRSVVFQDRSGRDGSALLASAGAGDCRPRLWDALIAHSDAIHGLAWQGGMGSEGLLLSGCEKGSVAAHDLRMSSPAWTLDLAMQSLVVRGGGGGGICCFATVSENVAPSFSRGGDTLVVAGLTGGYVCVINAKHRTVVAVHRPHTDDVRSISVHSGGVRPGDRSFGLVTTSFDGLGSVWNVQDSGGGENESQCCFRLESVLKGHGDKILGVSSGVRNKMVEILTTGADGKAILWTRKNSTPPSNIR